MFVWVCGEYFAMVMNSMDMHSRIEETATISSWKYQLKKKKIKKKRSKKEAKGFGIWNFSINYKVSFTSSHNYQGKQRSPGTILTKMTIQDLFCE